MKSRDHYTSVVRINKMWYIERLIDESAEKKTTRCQQCYTGNIRDARYLVYGKTRPTTRLLQYSNRRRLLPNPRCPDRITFSVLTGRVHPISTGGLGHLALARWAGWSAGQVGRHYAMSNDLPCKQRKVGRKGKGNDGQSHKQEREGGSGTVEGPQGPLAREAVLHLDIWEGVPKFLVTPLLMGPVCLPSQGRFEEL